MARSASGSSYCIHQMGGGERVGGVTVVLRPPGGATGTITVRPTDRRTGEVLRGIDGCVAAAERGVRAAASEFSISLDDVDVVITDFLCQTVDSRELIYYGAARSAFLAAWDGWGRYNDSTRRPVKPD